MATYASGQRKAVPMRKKQLNGCIVDYNLVKPAIMQLVRNGALSGKCAIGVADDTLYLYRREKDYMWDDSPKMFYAALIYEAGGLNALLELNQCVVEQFGKGLVFMEGRIE